MKRILFSILFLLTIVMVKATDIDIIPYPQSVTMKDGIGNLALGFNIKGEKQNQDYLKNILISDFELSPNTIGIAIELETSDKIDRNNQAYRLTISPKKEVEYQTYPLLLPHMPKLAGPTTIEKTMTDSKKGWIFYQQVA
jgi:hypothetical protein